MTNRTIASGISLFVAIVLAGGVAHADVFSSQSFDGGSTTLDSLPGVNLDAVPGIVSDGNCTERDVSSYDFRAPAFSGTVTECKFGNFSVNSVTPRSYRPGIDLTYGANPPPWDQGWRPSD